MPEPQQNLGTAEMASNVTAAAKQQLRSLMKQRLSELSSDAVGAQSEFYTSEVAGKLRANQDSPRFSRFRVSSIFQTLSRCS
jgi:hypothetical protein